MNIQDAVAKIILNTCKELVQAADDYNYDRDNIIQYAAEILSTMGEIATFNNLDT